MGPQEAPKISKADALAEAYKRGLLPPDKKAAYEEAQKRGLVGAQQPSNGAGMGPVNPMVEMGQRAQAQYANPNAPNPIITAQRASLPQANAEWLRQQEAEKRYSAELAAMNAASPIPFKNTGPDGPIELNQERPDLLATRAFGQAVNTNIGTVNSGIDMAGKVGVAYGAGLDPSVQGALAANEYYRGDSDAPERLAAAVQQSGAADQMQRLNERGDVVPRIPIPEAQTAGEMGADIAGTLAGYIIGPGKGINKVSRDVGDVVREVPGISRTVRGVGGEAIENAAHAYTFGSSIAPEGADRNMAGLSVATDPLSYVGIEAIRAVPRGLKALDSALTGPGVTAPTNAGGANLGPVRPQAPQPTPQSSVAPVSPPPVSNAPRRGAQPAPPGAGQGAGAPATLQATPRSVSAPINREELAIQRDTAKAVSRFMRGARVPRNLVDDYVGTLLGRYEPLKSERYPLAFFIEEDLPQFLQSRGYSAAEARNLAGDVAIKTDGWGRAANSFNASGNSSRYTMQDTIHQLTTTQKDELSGTFREILGDEALIGRSDEIGALMRQNGEQAYTNSIAEANRLIADKIATPAQSGAVAEMVMLMKTPAYRELVPESWAIEATTTGRTLDDVIDAKIADDPISTAHWMQSQIGEAARGAKNLDGTPNKTSSAYETRRKALLNRLEQFPGYSGARMQHGDLYGADDAISFGDRFLTTARSEYKTDLMKREFDALSPRQKEVAALSIRDALLNPLLRSAPEDAAATITQLQKEGTLKALVTVLGDERGNALRNAISSMRVENQRIAAISQASNSSTHLNQQGAKDAIDNLRGPGNRMAHAAGNPAGWGTAIGLDLLGGHGVFTGAKMAGSIFDKVTTPGRRFQSRVTKGLYGLKPSAADEALDSLPSPGGETIPPPTALGSGAPTRAPRRQGPPKAPITAQEWAARIEKDQNELQRLLRQYDQIDRADPNVDDLMRDNLNKQRNARRRISDKRKKMEAAGAAPQELPADTAIGSSAPTKPKRPLPGQTSSASPTVTGALVGGGLGYLGSDGDPTATLAGAVGGGGLGALVGRSGRGPKRGPKAPRNALAAPRREAAPEASPAPISSPYTQRNNPVADMREGATGQANAQRQLREAEAYRKTAPQSEWEALDQEIADLRDYLGMPKAAPSSTVKPPGAPKPANALKAPPKPPGGGVVSRMVTGGVIGGIAGSAASADPQEAAAINEFLAPLAEERKRISGLEKELNIILNGTVEEKQAYLAQSRGLKISASGEPDGKLGPDTRAAIAKARTELETAIREAQSREKDIGGKAEKRRAEIEMKAAYDRTKPSGVAELARELGPWAGIGAGVLAGTLMRRGAVKKTALQSSKKAASLNRLVSDATPTTWDTMVGRKAMGKRTTNLNEFFHEGGAGKPDNLKQRLGLEAKQGVPFKPDGNGNWMGNPNAKDAFDLFKPGTKHFKMMDVAVIGAAMAESEFAGNLAKGFHEEAKQAQAAVDKAQKEGNAANLEIAMARLESAKNAEAAAIAFQRFGQVAALARAAGAFKMPYEYTRPNVKKAQADQALILDAINRSRNIP